VKIEQLGKYLSVDDAKKWWNGGWLHRKNPLLELSTEKIEEIKAEYAKQVEVLATEEGVLLDITTFFVLARK
jgi:protein-L-isoaspartate(D-aspartate) O-methyltransferase